MRRVLLLFLVLMTPLLSNPEKTPRKSKVGVCIMATGRYDTYAQSLIESARRYFCLNQDVKYFVFTDGKQIQEAKDVIKIPQTILGWPFDNLKRAQLYDEHLALFKDFDYIFSIDADMVFVSPVGDEVLSNLVATQHPAFLKKRGTYENKKTSAAYVGSQEGQHYYTSQFFGGSKQEFIALVKVVRRYIDTDLARSLIARWHTESYLNRYFIDHPPTRILTASYCYPEDWKLDLPKKIVVASHQTLSQKTAHEIAP